MQFSPNWHNQIYLVLVNGCVRIYNLWIVSHPEGYSGSFQILAATNSAATWCLDHGAFCEALLRVNSGCGSAECTASFRGRARPANGGKGVQDLCYTFHNPPVGSPASVFLTMDGISSTAPDETLSCTRHRTNWPPAGDKGWRLWALQSGGPGPQLLHLSQRNNDIYI